MCKDKFNRLFVFLHSLILFADLSDSKKNQEKAQLLKENGNEYFKNTDYFKSIELYSQSISVYPTAVCYGNRSFAYYKLQKFAESLDDAKKSIQLDKNYAKGYFRRAEAYMALQSYELAMADFEHSSRIQPNPKTTMKLNESKQKQAEALKEEGNNILKAGNVKKAIDFYTKSTGLLPIINFKSMRTQYKTQQTR